MYQNAGNGTFTDISAVFLQADSTVSYSSAWGDLNNDGYLDLVINNRVPDSVHCWLSSGGNKQWIKIKLRGNSGNSMGLGAWIELYYGGHMRSHYTLSGGGRLSQNALYHHFSLDSFQLLDSIVVAWSCGHVDKRYNISANQPLQIDEGSTGPIKVKIAASNNGLICQNDSTRLYTKGAFKTYYTTQSIYIVNSGSYQVTATDINNNISIDSTTISFANSNNIQVQTQGPSGAGCADGKAQFLVNINPILYFFWPNNPNSRSINNLQSGFYTHTIQDNNGCADSLSFVLNEPTALTANPQLRQFDCFSDRSGRIDLTMQGGTPSYQYN